jgi:HSP20 family protein
MVFNAAANVIQERAMNLVQFEPWSIADIIRRDFDPFTNRSQGTAQRLPATWSPAVDIVEEARRFVLRADVPGVDAADIDVSMEDGTLTLAGERRGEDRPDFEGVQRFERATGRFSRRFTLPESADAQNVTAKTRNGILEISIPKQPEVQPRRITVEAA